MQLIVHPDKATWSVLSTRPTFDSESLAQSVKDITNHVRANGDEALRTYTKKLDGVDLMKIQVSPEAVKKATEGIADNLKNAIQTAYNNISTFHEKQQLQRQVVETMPGVKCWRQSLPIEKVGLYIPGGSAPLFSTILMLGVPAKIAGCKEVVLCTPPDKQGQIHPAILYTAGLIGISKIFKVGGAQAIAAMAFGTQSIPSVFKIFGPGNQFVTKAKELVQQHGVAIDMPAGPSEALVIADETCHPGFVAADLLSQAEHGIDSQVILVSNSQQIIKNCLKAVGRQLQQLPRKAIAEQALANSKAILLDNLDQCFDFSNQYAPEHLIVASDNAMAYVDNIKTAGSVFLGHYSCESAGDYASGTNHTLPTNGFAKNYSGVSLDSFVKKITFQEITPKGIQEIGPAIEIMAEAEGLMAHKNAVSIRLRDLDS